MGRPREGTCDPVIVPFSACTPMLMPPGHQCWLGRGRTGRSKGRNFVFGSSARTERALVSSSLTLRVQRVWVRPYPDVGCFELRPDTLNHSRRRLYSESALTCRVR